LAATAIAQPDVVQLIGADDVTLSARCCNEKNAAGEKVSMSR